MHLPGANTDTDTDTDTDIVIGGVGIYTGIENSTEGVVKSR